MNQCRIELSGGPSFHPGEVVTGFAEWDLPGVTGAEVRLFWRTSGKGTPDTATAGVVRWERPAARERREFRLTLPDSPYSFSGKLISLLWAVELVVEPRRDAVRAEIVMSPTGKEIRLGGG